MSVMIITNVSWPLSLGKHAIAYLNLPDPVCVSRYREDLVSSNAASGYLKQCGNDP